MGSRGSFMGVKRLGREAHQSPQSSAEVTNEWSYTSTPSHAFMARRGTTVPTRGTFCSVHVN